MSRASSDTVSGSNVATFIKKLWKIVETRENNDVISWSDDGNTLVVKNEIEFSKILPRYFKHSNYISFVRQLNLYGFRKVSTDHGSLIRDNPEPQLYCHPSFRRGHPEDLHLVVRKVYMKKAASDSLKWCKGEELNETPVSKGAVVESGMSTSLVRSENPQRLSEVMSDINVMKGRQKSISSVLDALKQDNTHLRHEISVLKEKHVRQQKILNKIIHFLVHMVYSKGKIPHATAARRPPRSTPLMLMDSEDNQLLPAAKKLRMATDSDLSDEGSLFDVEGITDFDQNMPLLSSSSDIVHLPSPDSFISSPLPIAPATTDVQPADSMALQPYTSVQPGSNITTVALPTSLASHSLEQERRHSSSSTLSASLSTGPPSALVPTATALLAANTVPHTSDDIVPSLSTASLSPTSLLPATSVLPATSLSPALPSSLSSSLTPSLPSTLTSSLPPSLTSTLPPSLTSTLPPSLTSTVLASSTDFPIPTNLLEEHPISPAPPSLAQNPHPENRMCLNGQINHQQVCIDNLQDLIGNFVMDPSIFSEYMSSENSQEYDAETANIFENVLVPSPDNLTAINPDIVDQFRAALPDINDVDEEVA